MNGILIGAIMGIGGTIAMDFWAWALTRFADQPAPNWAMPGRWLAYVFKGRVFHDSISAASPVQGELRLGWVFHYAVGLIYGVIFIALAGTPWLAEPAFLPLWVFSLLTIAAGWFLLHPGMGLGWAASKTPNPWKTRIMGLLAHTAFALGMWIVAVSPLVSNS
jgi:hypothetical protein